jgi:hypothetical protein
MQKLKTFWYSFQNTLLNPSYYQEIAKARYWFSFKYLFFLLVCLSLVRTVQLGTAYSLVRDKIPSYISIGKTELLKLYPKELELRISNGKLYTNVEEPYTVEIPAVFGDNLEKHLLVIDTEGKADDYLKYNTLVLATRQAVVYPEKQQGDRTTTQMYYFSELKRSLYIDYSLYKKGIDAMGPYLDKLPRVVDITVIVGLILLPIFGGLLWTSGTLFGLVFFTAIVWVIEKIVKTSYGYKTLYRMGMHGVTWAILFTFLLDITSQKVDNIYSIIFVIWMTFVLYKNQVKLLTQEKHI